MTDRKGEGSSSGQSRLQTAPVVGTSITQSDKAVSVSHSTTEALAGRFIIELINCGRLRAVKRVIRKGTNLPARDETPENERRKIGDLFILAAMATFIRADQITKDGEPYIVVSQRLIQRQTGLGLSMIHRRLEALALQGFISFASRGTAKFRSICVLNLASKHGHYCLAPSDATEQLARQLFTDCEQTVAPVGNSELAPELVGGLAPELVPRHVLSQYPGSSGASTEQALGSSARAGGLAPELVPRHALRRAAAADTTTLLDDDDDDQSGNADGGGGLARAVGGWEADAAVEVIKTLKRWDEFLDELLVLESPKFLIAACFCAKLNRSIKFPIHFVLAAAQHKPEVSVDQKYFSQAEAYLRSKTPKDAPAILPELKPSPDQAKHIQLRALEKAALEAAVGGPIDAEIFLRQRRDLESIGPDAVLALFDQHVSSLPNWIQKSWADFRGEPLKYPATVKALHQVWKINQAQTVMEGTNAR